MNKPPWHWTKAYNEPPQRWWHWALGTFGFAVAMWAVASWM